MNEEKLKKEAWGYMVDHAILNETNEDVEQAYFDAAKPREKRIEELENKLSEAKEILMKIAKSFDDMCFMNALSQAREFLAEQFLEEAKV